MDEADRYRREEETAKIVAKDDLAQIGEWSAGIEEKFAKAEQEMKRLKTWNDEYSCRLGEELESWRLNKNFSRHVLSFKQSYSRQKQRKKLN